MNTATARTAGPPSSAAPRAAAGSPDGSGAAGEDRRLPNHRSEPPVPPSGVAARAGSDAASGRVSRGSAVMTLGPRVGASAAAAAPAAAARVAAPARTRPDRSRRASAGVRRDVAVAGSTGVEPVAGASSGAMAGLGTPRRLANGRSHTRHAGSHPVTRLPHSGQLPGGATCRIASAIGPSRMPNAAHSGPFRARRLASTQASTPNTVAHSATTRISGPTEPHGTSTILDDRAERARA